MTLVNSDMLTETLTCTKVLQIGNLVFIEHRKSYKLYVQTYIETFSLMYQSRDDPANMVVSSSYYIVSVMFCSISHHEESISRADTSQS